MDADGSLTATSGFLSNEVTASSNETTDRTDDLDILIVQSPDMSVVKSSGTSSLSAPVTVTYTYLVTNEGNVTLTGVSLSDDNDEDDMSCPSTTIAVGADMTCSATHVFTQAELDADGSPTATSGFLSNEVTASSNETTDRTDDLDIPITQDPSISIDKTPDFQIVAAGGDVTFTIVVSNTGNVTLDPVSVSVSDVLAPDCDTSDLGSLAPGASAAPYTCVVVNVTVGFTNVAEATGTPGVGGDVTDNDDAVVAVAEIQIVKSAVTPVVESGDTATFAITVTNVGEVNLLNTAIADGLVADCVRSIEEVRLLSNGKTAVGHLLKVGESFSYECTEASVTAGFTNSATATAVDSASAVPVEDTDTAPVAVAQITITKTVTSDLPILDGAVVSFLITVTNTGEVNIIDTAITDALVAQCGRDIETVKTLSNGKTAVGTLLKVGESFSYPCADEVGATFTNVAEVTGTASGVPVSDSDDAFVPVVSPDITIVKSPEVQTLPNSGSVRFTITVTNTGDVNLINTAVADEMMDSCSRSIAEVMTLSNGKTAVGTLLKVGESFTYECEAEVAEGFENEAVATAWWLDVVQVSHSDKATVLDPNVE